MMPLLASMVDMEKLSKKEGLTKNKLKTTPETLTEINILKSKSDTSYIGSIGIFEVLSFIDTENGDKFRKFTLTNPTKKQTKAWKWLC